MNKDVSPANPFGVADVPDPDAEDVDEFANWARLDGNSDDPNGSAWAPLG